MADIAPIYEYAKLILGTDHTGHGFDHVVAAMAKQIIAEDQLQVDDYVVEAAAFLHDTIDDKVVKDVVKAKEEVQQCLLAAGATAEQISHIFTIIENLSFLKRVTGRGTSLLFRRTNRERCGSLRCIRRNWYFAY